MFIVKATGPYTKGGVCMSQCSHLSVVVGNMYTFV